MLSGTDAADQALHLGRHRSTAAGWQVRTSQAMPASREPTTIAETTTRTPKAAG
jgi:hypothetical protein